MVVNADKDSIEQITHYYPYGGVIGNLSSNQEAQRYKYSGKELDRTYGLDLYDFQARLLNPALPVFDRPDPLAEKYYSISPYAYCAGDPVNCVDPDGKAVNLVAAAVGGVIGGTVGAGIAWFQGGSTNDIIGAAAGGFVAGGMAGLTMGTSLVAGGGCSAYVASAGVGAISNVTGEIVKETTTSSLNNGELTFSADGEKCKEAAIIGGVAGAVGKSLEQATNSLEQAIVGATNEMNAINRIPSGNHALRESVKASSKTKLNASEVTTGVQALKSEAIESVSTQREVLSAIKYTTSSFKDAFNAAGTYGIDPATYEKK